MSRLCFVAGAVTAAILGATGPAAAIPVFAHRYALSCQTCHTVVPHLTAFGEAFLAAGYRVPGRAGQPIFPVAAKLNLHYGSETGGGLPKAVVDEVELLTGGRVGERGAYFAEQYVVDGGLPGRTRDLWAAWQFGPAGARTPVALRAGQFTLDLPLDPETFRETTDHYAIWDQTAGDNPFAFFTPKTGVELSAGTGTLTATLAAMQGHDVASGLPSRGIDRYVFVQHADRALTLSAYRLDGSRALAAGDDRFWREGYGAGYSFGRIRLDAVYQRGFDTAAASTARSARPEGSCKRATRHRPHAGSRSPATTARRIRDSRAASSPAPDCASRATPASPPSTPSTATPTTPASTPSQPRC